MSLQFQSNGFEVTVPLLSAEECQTAIAHLTTISSSGKRNLLLTHWCISLARMLASHPVLEPLLPTAAVAIQCTLFEKSPERNWLVSLHQDLSIPVASRINHSAVRGWSEKEGVLYVQAPAAVLADMVAVRLQLDESGPNDGALRVVPGSHLYGRLDDAEVKRLRDNMGEIVCPVPKGAALVIRPLLLHGSSKLTQLHMRRVLHFLFAPPVLPFGLRWAHAVNAQRF
ncbi:MAG: phytanoyl-CoA dioxygenase family protein [Thermosynechococcaceae cyanobacterium]